MKKLLLLLIPFWLIAGDIKPLKQQELQLKKEQATLESDLFKDGWINPLMIIGSTTKANVGDPDKLTEKKLGLHLSQDIFRSGGIYYQREKAKKQKVLFHRAIDLEERHMQMRLYALVLSLKKLDLSIDQTLLLVKNKALEIEVLNDKYLNGLVDIAMLDSAMIELGDLQNSVEDLYMTHQELHTELSFLSDKKYSEITLAHFKMIDLDTYLKYNSVTLEKEKITIQKLDKKLTDTKYLPKLTLEANYQYDESIYTKSFRDDKNALSYGVGVSMPLDFNMQKDRELAQKNYMLSKIAYRDLLDNEVKFYEQVEEEIKIIDKKIKNHQNILSSYHKLFVQVKDLYENSLKTKEDVVVVENTKKIKEKAIEIEEVNKKLALVKLYGRML
ncbi:MAG: TolC family protein [Epsilonproteobacteria bacterium]|nr:TolC family protein [Campylobacterota bacterium]